MQQINNILQIVSKTKTKLNSLRDKDNDGYLEIALRDKNEIKSNLENIERLIKVIQKQLMEVETK